MTVALDYQPSLYIADGKTKTFSYNFSLTLSSDIRVYTISDRGEKTLVSVGDYVQSVTPDNKGGNITFNVAPSDGTNILIERTEVPTQEKDWKNTEGFNLKSLTDEFDKLTRWLQEVDASLDRAITIPENAQNTPIEIWNRMILSDVLESVRLLKIENGNLYTSKDGDTWIMMPKSATIQEFRHRHITDPERDIFEYRIGDTWFEVSIDPSKLVPSQAAHAGEYLTTDGKDTMWAPINAGVTSVNGQDGNVVLTGDDIQATLNGNDTASITDHLQTLKNDESELGDQVAGIESKIPGAASPSNQLADKNFVNSSIQTAASNFRGNWDTWADVPTSADEYPVNYAGSRTPTVNDYLVVGDASGYPEASGQALEGTWRFKYSGTWATNGKNGWLPEYQVNNQPLTQEQLAVLKSGITAEKVEEYDAYPDQFVKKSGDTMTGELLIDTPLTPSEYLNNKEVFKAKGTYNTSSYEFSVSVGTRGVVIGAGGSSSLRVKNGLVPEIGESGAYLGLTQSPWRTVYTQSINGNLLLPDGPGTLALASDLPDAKTGTAGQVYTKTADGAEWQDATGGGVAEVAHDATLSGNGTAESPLSVIKPAVIIREW